MQQKQRYGHFECCVPEMKCGKAQNQLSHQLKHCISTTLDKVRLNYKHWFVAMQKPEEMGEKGIVTEKSVTSDD